MPSRPRFAFRMNPDLTLILGGCRSGKSRRAEALALESGLPVTYVATWLPGGDDPEMAARIRAHRERRPVSWRTVEGRLDLAAVFRENRDRLVLLDSLGLWVSARMAEDISDHAMMELLDAALAEAGRLIVVSDDAGGGLIPDNACARRFRDLCGLANQRVAERAGRVEYLIAGIPMVLKGS